jgi:hypothetical protein
VGAVSAAVGRGGVAEQITQLLNAIVRDLLITDSQKDVDLNAPAEESAAAIQSEKSRIVALASEQERTLAPAFRTGLLLAFEAQGVGKSEIRLDDRDPQQNAIADALIIYLVRYDLAESRSEEIAPGHYAYFVSVNWDALYRFAGQHGIDLPAALAKGATIPGG